MSTHADRPHGFGAGGQGEAQSHTCACRLSVHGICTSLAGRRILDGITLSIPSGSVLAVIGPSGAGKTTLLRSLALLALPDCGELFFENALVFRATPAGPNGLRRLLDTLFWGDSHRSSVRRESYYPIHQYRQLVSMVFQGLNLWSRMTVLENLTIGPTMASGIPRPEARQSALQMLSRLGLVGLESRYPSQLSGGQRQRVALARTLLMKPKVLLADEITASLDPELTGDVLRLLRDLAADGLTMVVVTHHLEFARAIAHRIAFIDQGRIVELGPPTQLLDAPRHERTQQFIAQLLGAN